MAKNIALILFLSEYKGQPEADYSTDLGFGVKGAQTNEAPVKYAIRRLAKTGDKISRILALTTQTAASALDKFRQTVSEESPETVIDEVKIPDNVTATDLLRKILNALLPPAPSMRPDSVVIETTGGYRTAINTITLLARFLRYSKIDVAFSTYSDFAAKRVEDTHETDGLFALLDAVNVFAATGNVREIENLFADETEKQDEKTAFFQAANHFYNSLLVCRMPRLESDIQELRSAFDALRNAEYAAENAKLLIFRELVLNIVEKKMTFLYSETPFADFIAWCADNWYLQQAVTFFRENLKRRDHPKGIDGKHKLPSRKRDLLTALRNNINHASGRAEYDEATPYITEKIVRDVNRLLENTNEIQEFVVSSLKALR